MLTVAEERSS